MKHIANKQEGQRDALQSDPVLLVKVMLHRTIRNDDFLHNSALQCSNNIIVTIRNNVATLRFAKNRPCDSSRVTSP